MSRSPRPLVPFLLIGIAIVSVALALTANSAKAEPTSSAISSPSVSVSGIYSFTENFSDDPVGLPPAGWDQFGRTTIVPVVKQVGSSKVLEFPGLPGGQGAKWMAYHLKTWTEPTVTVKINFQDSVADCAGILLAWKDSNSYVDIVPNVFWDNIGFDEWVDGVWKQRIETPRWGIRIDPGTDYYLRVATGHDGSGAGTATVYWSADGGKTYQRVLDVKNLANLTGRVGLMTGGLNIPHVYFSNLTVTSYQAPVTLQRTHTVPFSKSPYWKQVQTFANKNAGYGGFHSGEDWVETKQVNTGWASSGVFSIADGLVTKITDLSASGKGKMIFVEHYGLFNIKGKAQTTGGQAYRYGTEQVSYIYSTYLHVLPASGIVQGTVVKAGQKIADIDQSVTAANGGPHLHFEVRKPLQIPPANWSANWSMIGPSTNWINGYYVNVQKMVDDGMRHPSEFVANNR